MLHTPGGLRNAQKPANEEKEGDIFNEDQARLGKRRQDRYESKITPDVPGLGGRDGRHCPRPWQSVLSGPRGYNAHLLPSPGFGLA